MKIVVTGANGYIGFHVVKSLLENCHEVIAVDTSLERLERINSRAIKYPCSILDKNEKFYEKWNHPDALIHLAWQDGFSHNSESHIDNLPLHFHFIKNLIESGLKHVAVMGTMHEVGYHEGAIDESTPNNPISFYGIAKNTLRQLFETYLKDKDVVFQWLRGFYITGDDGYNHSIFTKILDMERERMEYFPFTDGKNQYDFISVTALSSQINAVVSQKEITGIINCCSGKPVSLKEKIEEYLKENNLKIKPDYGKFPGRAYDSPVIYGDSTKINKIVQNIK